MNSWNGLDFFIFLIFALNTIIGMSRGASKEIISTLCLSVALIFTIKFTVPLASLFNSSPLMSSVVNNDIMQNFMTSIGAGPITDDLLRNIFYSISLLICFVGAFSICEGALSMTGVVEMYPFPYAALNRKIGGGLGFTRGYVINMIFLVILCLHLSKESGAFTANSFFVGLFRGSIVNFDAIITGQKPEAYRDMLIDKNLYNEGQMLNTLQQQTSQPQQ
jgi:hypothetical protein